MAHAYTTQARVEELLPSSISSTIKAAIPGWITDASREVDGEVGPDYPMGEAGQKFADQPDTPFEIEQCARWLAGHYAYIKIKEVSRASEPFTQGELYRKWAMDKLAKIRRGEIQVFGEEGADLAEDAPAGVSVAARTQVFTQTELDRY